MLGIKNSSLTPTDLIRSILRMRVDLLWNGGIGTYVKGKAESHADVGDRSNDHVRVNADELRCRVVGEGGNLGLTSGRESSSRSAVDTSTRTSWTIPVALIVPTVKLTSRYF